jgi:hypothetical protein
MANELEAGISSPVKSKKTVRPASGALWLVGLPVLGLLAVLVVFALEPIQTRQVKEFVPLSGQGGRFIVYNLTLEYPNPRKLTLKMAGDTPVGFVIKESGEQVFQTQITPDGVFEPVAIELPPGIGTRNREISLELTMGGKDWKLGYHKRNVYREGDFAPVSGTPGGGDLYFVVDYGVNPALRVERYFAEQARWGGIAWLFPFWLLVNVGLGLFGLIKAASNPQALANRIVYRRQGYFGFSFFCLALGASWALSYLFFNPPIQGPDEQAHVVRSIAEGRGVAAATLESEIQSLMEAARTVDNFAWLSYDEPILQQLPANAQARQPGLYYFVSGTLVKLASPFVTTFAGQSYVARLASILFLLGTIGAALSFGFILRRSSPWLALSLPLTLALWSQLLFLGSVTGNDSAVICWGAWVMVGMLRLYRAREPGDWILGGLVVGGGLLLSYWTKGTWIILAPGIAAGLWLLVAWRGRKPFRIIWLGLTGLAIVGFVVAFFALTDTTAARGWYSPAFRAVSHAQPDRIGIQKSDGTSGYGLRIGTEQPLEQPVDMFYRAEVQRVFVKGQIRAENAPARLKIELIAPEPQVQPILAEIKLDLNTTDWADFGFEAVVPPEVPNSRIFPYMVLRLSLPDGATAPVLLGSARLYANQPNGDNLLVNPDLKEGVATLNKNVAASGYCLLCDYVNYGLDILSNGRGLDITSGFVQSTAFLFLTSWGTYGWGQIFLSPIWYVLGLIVTFLSFIGLIRLTLRFKLEAWQKAFGACCILIALIAYLLLQAVKLWAWFLTGAQDFAAGRFIFVIVIVLSCLLLTGLRGLGGRESRIGIWLWLWASFLFLFNFAAIWGDLSRFYY